MNAAMCFTERLATQGVQVPEPLQRELRLACLLPFFNIHELYDRLMVGCAVLDKRGEVNAPDHLWQRWEAIFIAWHCCWEAFNAIDRAPIVTAPAQPELQRPTIIGIRSRKGH